MKKTTMILKRYSIEYFPLKVWYHYITSHNKQTINNTNMKVL
jgi:hypothetical protein